MKSKLYIGIFFFAIALSTGYARDNNKTQCCQSCCFDPGEGPGHGKECDQLTPIYNAPARIDPLCNWDVFLETSFIYWNAKEDGLFFGIRFDPENNTDTVNSFDMGKIHFKYEPGFKVALGTNLGHDDWTLKAEYTWLHLTTNSTTINSTAPNPNLLTMSWFEPNINDDEELLSATANWENDLDLLDVELSRPFYSGRAFILSPFIGPRFVWIDQVFNISAVPDPDLNVGNFIATKWKQRSWAIGIRAGADFKWEVAYGFRFFGDFAGALTYRKQTVQSAFTGIPDPSSLVASNGTVIFKYVKPNSDTKIGIGWGSYFSDQFWHFDVALGYSFLYFWGENGMRHVADVLDNRAGNKAGDLWFHGLDLTLRFDF